MSFAGKYTPLQLNAVSGLSRRTGLTLNPTAAALQGVYSPTNYTQGDVTSGLLSVLTANIPRLYNQAASNPAAYRSLLSMGSVCPALANTKPATYVPSYTGYGSWTKTGSNIKRVGGGYPSRDYPTSTAYSWIQLAWGSLAYITGWPGQNTWQKIIKNQTVTTRTGTYRFESDVIDQYIAAYPPLTANEPINNSDEYFKHGFIGTIARQAYNELWTDNFSQYNSVLNSFSQSDGWRSNTNKSIASFVNTKSQHSGIYSNINDYTTNDVSGVSLSYRLFGQDMLNLGRALTFASISKFGYPSNLLLTLNAQGALTDSVKIALSLSGLGDRELQSILENLVPATRDQERKIYDALKLIRGDDLYSLNTGITFRINLKTLQLESLADLLNPRKMFPSSYTTLTVPKWTTDSTASSKIYYLIYNGNNVNNQVSSIEYVDDFAGELRGILPDDIALACAAFKGTMMQIVNITQTDIQRFATALVDLEVTDKALPLIAQATGTPGSVAAANTALTYKALGSGNANAYRQCDFYGAAAGYPYEYLYRQIVKIYNLLPTATLRSLYERFATVTINELQILVNQCNAEISRIYAANTELCDRLNYYWDQLGTQLLVEQRAWAYAIQTPEDLAESADSQDFDNFVRNIEQYALDNSDGESGYILERISDLANITGQSIVAVMREARNNRRLGEAGTPANNDVSDQIDLCSASAVATVTAGSVSNISVTSSSQGYSSANPPNVTVYPVLGGCTARAIITDDGSISRIEILNPGRGYSQAQVIIEPPPRCIPTIFSQITTDISNINVDQDFGDITDPTYPGPDAPPSPTFTDNPVPPAFPPTQPGNDGSYTPDEAINEVTRCNCERWDC